MSKKKTIDDALIAFIEGSDDAAIQKGLSESIENMDEFESKAQKLEEEINLLIKSK